MKLKEWIGILHLPIGIIICLVDIEYLRWMVHPYWAFLIWLMGLWFMFIGLAVIVSYFNGIENPVVR